MIELKQKYRVIGNDGHRSYNSGWLDSEEEAIKFIEALRIVSSEIDIRTIHVELSLTPIEIAELKESGAPS